MSIVLAFVNPWLTPIAWLATPFVQALVSRLLHQRP